MPVLFPNPGFQAAIDERKAYLQALVNERRAAGGPMPTGIDTWSGTLERHPWLTALTTPRSSRRRASGAASAGEHGRGQGDRAQHRHDRMAAAGWLRVRLPEPAGQHALGPQPGTAAWPSAPSKSVTFDFSVTVPPPPSAVFQWRKVQDGGGVVRYPDASCHGAYHRTGGVRRHPLAHQPGPADDP